MRWLGAAAGAVLLGLLGVELVLRLVFPAGMIGRIAGDELYPWMVFDPLLAWRNRPGFGQGEVRFDEHGLRVGPAAAEVPAAPAARRPLTVLCLGDSRTFGVRLDQGAFRYDNDYPRRLEALAHQGLAPLRVLNAGTVGYTSSQGLRQWLVDLDALHPDVVVAAFGLNDHLASWNRAYRVTEPDPHWARSLFYRFARLRLIEASLWLARRSPLSERGPDGRPWVDLDRHRRDLERFVEEARSRHRRLLFLDLPLRPLERGEDLPAFGDSTPTDWRLFGVGSLAELHRVHGEYSAALRQVALRHGVPVIDVGAAMQEFRAAHPGAELFSAYDFAHPNGAGADLVARVVLEEMIRLGWLPRPLSPAADGGGSSAPNPPAAPAARR